MLPASRTAGEGFAIPTFDLTPPDVAGLLEELWEFQSALHDCFARSEARAHFFDSMVGQWSPRERKSIEPMALRVDGGLVRGLQRFLSDGPGMRSRWSGTIGSSWRRRGATWRASCWSMRPALAKRARSPWGGAAGLWPPGQGRALPSGRVCRLGVAAGLCPGGQALVPP
jgi:hypothetical protein